jgi:nitrogen fixation protein FixH
MIAKARPFGIRGVHVAIMMVAFFAVIIALDALFITFAIQSHPGEKVKNSYVLGLEYNKELARQAEQKALGWELDAGLVDDDATLLVRLTDAAGKPLEGLAVAARMHVAGIRQDLAPVWLAERAPGEYAMAATLQGPAKVDTVIAVSHTRDGAPVFEAAKTLVLK